MKGNPSAGESDEFIGTAYPSSSADYNYAPTATIAQPTPFRPQSVDYHVSVDPRASFRPQRIINRWSDGICDWPKNLFPSCFCVCCMCDGCWLLAQMAQKTQFSTFNMVVSWAFVIWLVCIIIEIVFPGAAVVAWIPYLFLSAMSIALRFHIMRRDNIPGAGDLGECCLGFWCFSCSVAQMARHLYGYTKVFDGDADPDRPDNYGPVQQV